MPVVILRTMSIISHTILAIAAVGTIWILSGILIDAVDRVAKRYRRPGFAVAFFVLGILTSISEISVALNATFAGVPEVSAGNLLGASTVIFLLIIPILAIFGNGISMGKTMRQSTIAFLLGIVFLPSLFALDGSVIYIEGVAMLLLYAALVYRLQKKHSVERTTKEALHRTKRELLHSRHTTMSDVIKILVGAVLIFVAGNILVNESIYFAGVFGIPISIIGLLLLSIGTNIPELTIAVRCVVGKHKEIAFGDYMGSAAANTLIFSVLAIVNGSFTFEQSEALLTSVILFIGLTLFFLFLRSKQILSRPEGIVLLVCYALFLIFQTGNAYRISDGKMLSEAETELSEEPPIQE